jgi:hypothetical protein
MNILIAILATIVIWGMMNRFIKDEDDDFEVILEGIEEVLYQSIISIKKKLSWKKKN